MPFKSKAQQRFMFAAEERGDVPKGTAMEWAHKTPSIKNLPEKKTASEIALEVLAECQTPGMKIRSKGKGRGRAVGKGKGPVGVPVGLKSWDTLKEESKKKTASDLANAVLATDGRSSRVMHDFYEGGKWAPGGIEYQGPMKIAADLGVRQQHAQWHSQNDPAGTPPIDPQGQMTPERARRSALLLHILNANKQAAELPTNVADRAPMAIGSIIGAPKMKPPKFPSMPKAKKLASEIAVLVLQKVAAHGR